MSNFPINSKQLFLAHFRPIFPKFGAIFFFKCSSAAHIPIWSLPPCKVSEKPNVYSKETVGRTEGQTLIHRTLLATVGGPIINSLSNRSLPKPLLICGSYVDIFSLTILACFKISIDLFSSYSSFLVT